MRLALMLCRFPLLESELSGLASDVANSCGQVQDWELFMRLADHHRITSLIARNASSIVAPLPHAVSVRLRTQSSRNAIESFRYLAEVQRLLRIFEEAGIKARVIKGVALSMQAYGDVSTRDVGDIDLLVAPSDAARADRILQRHDEVSQGYVRTDPDCILTPGRFAAYIETFKDFTYQPAATANIASPSNFEIDLHWRLFRNPYMPGNGVADLQGTFVSAGAMQLHTLSPQANLLYLAVHGAVDGWTRLKAVADIAALWKGMGAAEQQVAMTVARQTRVLPYLHSALLLAVEWMGASGLPDPSMSAGEIKLAIDIATRARKNMEEHHFLPPLRESSSWIAKRHEFSLYPSWQYRRAILRRVLYRPRAWSRFDLPDKWFHLYPLLSPVEWLLFRLDRFRLRQSRRP